MRLGQAPPQPLAMIGNATSGSAESIVITARHAVGILRLESSGAERVAIVIANGRRGPRIAWQGRTDWTGDPGERHRSVVETADRTDDGDPDLIVGVMSESTAVCGETEALLFARAVDPRTGRLRPVELRRFPRERLGPALTVTRISEIPEPAALRVASASSIRGTPEDATLIAPPLGLLDRDPKTAWLEGRPGAGRWEFVTLRWNTPTVALNGVVLRVPAASDGRAAVEAPAAFWVVTDTGPAYQVRLPTALRAPGTVLRVAFPEPVHSRCLSIVLDDDRERRLDLGFAEIGVESELTRAGGIDDLVEAIARDQPDGDRATDVLAHATSDAAQALLERWPQLSVLGRRRTIRVLEGPAAHTPPSSETLDGLRLAASDDDPDVRTDAFNVIEGLEASAAVETLRELARDAPTASQSEAVRRLAVRYPQRGLAALLDLVASNPDHRDYRDALSAALSAEVESANEAVEGWLAGRGTVAPATIASLALALAGTEEAPAVLTRLLRDGAERAETFASRYRLVLAAERSDPDPPIDAWLESLVTTADEWMLRAAAVEAIAARGASPEVVAEALSDPYPRVRAAAVDALRPIDATSEPQIATLATQDRWPMVRARAVRALADTSDGIPRARAALADNASSVRAAGLKVLTERGDRGAAGLVAERLVDNDEWPAVLEVGIDFAQRLCVRDLVDPLGQVVQRGLRRDAWATGRRSRDPCRRRPPRTRRREHPTLAASRRREPGSHPCCGSPAPSRRRPYLPPRPLNRLRSAEAP